jgi:hypothetical protein
VKPERTGRAGRIFRAVPWFLAAFDPILQRFASRAPWALAAKAVAPPLPVFPVKGEVVAKGRCGSTTRVAGLDDRPANRANAFTGARPAVSLGKP